MANNIRRDEFFQPGQTRQDFANIVDSPQIKGFPFPLDRNNERGFFYQAVDHEVIKADLVQLLMTEPGERVMMPSFGTGLRKMLFEYGDQILYDEIKAVVIASISQWEPRIVVQEVNVSDGFQDERLEVKSDNVDEHSLVIQISYALKEKLDDIEKLDFRINYNSKNF